MKKFLKALNVDDFDKLDVMLGNTIDGDTYCLNLSENNGILVGGSNGSGKSNLLKGMICSLLKTHTPQTLKLILVDFKNVEYLAFEKSSYLYTTIIHTAQKYFSTSSKLLDEMNTRLELFKKAKCHNIKDYNNQYQKRKRIPYLMIVIDEFDKLMTTQNKSRFEDTINKLISRARAVGIIIICATQAIGLISGTLKANLLTRACFKVESKEKSKIVLDIYGAEKIKQKGKMLFCDASNFDYNTVQVKLLTNEQTVQKVNQIINKNE